MDKPILDAVMHRLNRLEHSNHWWRLYACVALIVLGLIILLGGTRVQPADEILAKRFILVDQGGKRRAMLGVETKEENPKAPGSTVLILYDRDDEAVRLNVNQTGDTGLILEGKKDSIFLHSGGLMIFGSNKEFTDLSPGQMSLSQDDRGDTRLSPGQLQLSRREGLAGLDLSIDEGPSIKLVDNKFVARAHLFLAADGSPGLAFLDKDGKPYTAVNQPAGESLLTAVPKLYYSCLQKKQSNPSLDCSEYHKAMELLIRVFRR
jgi:hypothetical protein